MNPDFSNSQQAAMLKKIVRDAVHETLASLGFTPHDPQQMQADMLYMRKARKGSDELMRLIRASSITVAISAAAYALFEGVRHVMRG
jgi:hypothetical protein